MNGFLILNKPKGVTSFDIVRNVRRQLKEKRVGHSGTLDPFASGLLILALGRYTKLFFLFDDYKKEYIATGVFGEEKDTDDITGNVLKYGDNGNPVSKDELKYILENNFTGRLSQVPPSYSAKHINGKRAYTLAREGVDFKLEKTDIEIQNIYLMGYDYPFFTIKTSVSKGTYIRSIIRDIGRYTNHLAYTKDLIRTKIGEYTIDMSVELDEKNVRTFSYMFPNIEQKIEKDEDFIKKLLCGNTYVLKDINLTNKYLAFLDIRGDLIALIKREHKKNIYAYVAANN